MQVIDFDTYTGCLCINYQVGSKHIYEYKCTDLGDIEDEGRTRAMNSNEMTMTDSLMGKLGFSAEDSLNLNSDNEKAVDVGTKSEYRNESTKKSKK